MNDAQRQLLEDLNLIEDPQERLTIVVDRARRRAPFADPDRIDSNRVAGCVSQVWLISEFRDGLCHFSSDAEGPLVKGLVALLCDYFNAASPNEILADDTNPVTALGLMQNLSPTRQNGLNAVCNAIRTFVQNHQ